MAITQQAPYQSSNRVAIFAGAGTGPAVYTYNNLETEDISAHPNSGSCEMTLANKARDEAWETHMDTYRGEVESVDPVTQTFSSGEELTLVGVSDSIPKLCALHLDGKHDGKYRLTTIYGVYTGNTGGFSTAAGSLGDTPVTITGIQNTTGAGITISGTEIQDAFSDLITTIPSDVVIPTGKVGVVNYISV